MIEPRAHVMLTATRDAHPPLLHMLALTKGRVSRLPTIITPPIRRFTESTVNDTLDAGKAVRSHAGSAAGAADGVGVRDGVMDGDARRESVAVAVAVDVRELLGVPVGVYDGVGVTEMVDGEVAEGVGV